MANQHTFHVNESAKQRKAAFVKSVEDEIKSQVGQMGRRELFAITRSLGSGCTITCAPFETDYMTYLEMLLNHKPGVESHLLLKISNIITEQYTRHYDLYVNNTNFLGSGQHGAEIAIATLVWKQSGKALHTIQGKAILMPTLKPILLKAILKYCLAHGISTAAGTTAAHVFSVLVIILLLVYQIEKLPEEVAKSFSKCIGRELDSGLVARCGKIYDCAKIFHGLDDRVHDLIEFFDDEPLFK